MIIPGGQDPLDCQIYLGGHTLHWVQNRHSIDTPHQMGRLIGTDGTSITVDYLTHRKPYRNHDVERLVDTVGIGNVVSICEQFAILRGGGAAFSICDVRRPWIDCDFEPFEPTSFESLAIRMKTHGGYSVPNEVLDGLPDG